MHFEFSHILPAGLVFGIPRIDPDGIVLPASVSAPHRTCPTCGFPSSAVHSRYERTIADLPWSGRRVRVLFVVRRFFCGNRECPRKTFAESVSKSAERHARRTSRQKDALLDLAFACGAEAAARASPGFGMPISADSLLRWMRGRARPAVPAGADGRPVPLTAVAVDDWAFRRGRRYGTIIIDLATNKPIELLPDRTADTLAAWLGKHPTIRNVARDRASAYAEGIRIGAPQARQSADRWHLLKNLLDHAGDALVGKTAGIRAAAAGIQVFPDGTASRTSEDESGPASETSAEALSQPPTRKDAKASARRDDRNALFADVAALHAAGASISAIGRKTGLDRKTIRSWLSATEPPSWRRTKAPHRAMDPFVPYLRARWPEGCRNAARLLDELRAKGYEGGANAVRTTTSPWRTLGERQKRRRGPKAFDELDPSGEAQAVDAAEEEAFRIPSRRQAAWTLCAPLESLSAAQILFRDSFEAADALASSIGTAARSFHSILMGKDRRPLPDGWRTPGTAPSPRSSMESSAISTRFSPPSSSRSAQDPQKAASAD